MIIYGYWKFGVISLLSSPHPIRKEWTSFGLLAIDVTQIPRLSRRAFQTWATIIAVIVTYQIFYLIGYNPIDPRIKRLLRVIKMPFPKNMNS